MTAPDKAFYDLVDQFINLANQLVPHYGSPRVSAVLLFAASRFNAHNYYATDGAEDTKQAAIDYFCEQYRAMLVENIDWLAPHYKSLPEAK
jgi:hypothetical protein